MNTAQKDDRRYSEYSRPHAFQTCPDTRAISRFMDVVCYDLIILRRGRTRSILNSNHPSGEGGKVKNHIGKCFT